MKDGAALVRRHLERQAMAKLDGQYDSAHLT